MAHHPKLLSLSAFKAKDLQHLAFLTGISSSGTKPTLISRLRHELPLSWTQDLPERDNRGAHEVRRILSLDLGLRNLAFCVLDIRKDVTRHCTSRTQQNSIATPEDLFANLDHDRTPILRTPTNALAMPPPSILSNVHIHTWRRLSLLPSTKESTLTAQTQQFNPKTLAPLAYQLITTAFLPTNSTHILIERQRYRSGGSAAVQEWTVRVNMLESMLVAMLVALRAQNASTAGAAVVPQVESVSPKRVAGFWIGGGAADSGIDPGINEMNKENDLEKTQARRAPKKPSSKVEKEAKIALADSWLRNHLSGSQEHFSSEALKTREHFLDVRDGKAAGKRRRKITSQEQPTEDDITGAGQETSSKLDDLADCLLQGVAWLQWEQNRNEAMRCLDLEEEQDAKCKD